ncbi:hypothetical protein RUND412_005170 [Rhizina undulata]
MPAVTRGRAKLSAQFKASKPNPSIKKEYTALPKTPKRSAPAGTYPISVAPIKTEELQAPLKSLEEHSSAPITPGAVTPLAGNAPSPESAPAPQRRKGKLVYPLGTSPFPDHPHPTPEECEEVVRLLTLAHGPAVRPKKVPKPDNSVSGCGEVPSVLDALVRTVLSANTSNSNSARAFQGLIDKFGLVPDNEESCDEDEEAEDKEIDEAAEQRKKEYKRKVNTGSGSVNWNNVRKAPIKDLIESIKTGGLAKTKAKTMKHILDQVWAEGKERIKKEKEAKNSETYINAGTKENEDIDMADVGESQEDEEDDDAALSLDYLHGMKDQEVLDKLTSFNGVGPKTASCVLLFCMQRPSFAVDTHVFRISKFLNWVPPEKATRETTYAHLDAVVPSEYKYPLHNLLIRHGRMCKFCKGRPESPPKPVLETEKKPRKVKKEDVDVGDVIKVGDVISKADSEMKKAKVKRTKKIWVGTGMMKEVVVEIESDGEGGGEREDEKCAIEGLVNRVRKTRYSKRW